MIARSAQPRYKIYFHNAKFLCLCFKYNEIEFNFSFILIHVLTHKFRKGTLVPLFNL